MKIVCACTRGIILGLSIVAASSCTKESVHWSYTGETGPDDWGRLSPEFATCATGLNQSPIDIVSPTEGDLGPIEIHYRGRTTETVNNGHTIQLNVEPGSWLLADGKKWNLAQLHFHSPSEHRVRGESVPLEAHFVHRGEGGDLAVLALLFRQGEADAHLASMWSGLPARAGDSKPLALTLSELGPAPDALLYYRYEGSLTTPPCAEGVRWYVLQSAKSVSPEQVAGFERVIGKNARTTQPLNGRQVLQQR